MCPSVNGSVEFCHLINGIAIDVSFSEWVGRVLSFDQRDRYRCVLQ